MTLVGFDVVDAIFINDSYTLVFWNKLTKSWDQQPPYITMMDLIPLPELL